MNARRALAEPVPPGVPRARPRLSRWLGIAWLRLTGWRLVGSFPDLAKAVVIVAPHSSNLDGFHGLAMRQAIGLDIHFLAKRQLFWWPLGAVLRGFGAIPIERAAAADLVEQAAGQFAGRPAFWLGLAPEGTRKPVARWKSGFWRIAKAANVAIVPAYFHYPDKVIGIGPPLWPGDDMDADLARLRAFYAPWRGAHGKRAV